ncbi:MAG: ABC transporter ATP-binding protein [Desulfobacteraceae bacterium]|nr:ABC transporter ATP-binding protein [Desulfobacteraceae bacterium]
MVQFEAHLKSFRKLIMSLIELRQVERIYSLGHTFLTALTAIDLNIEQGEFVAVWGPSGSGKSTLCNLVGALDLPTNGEVTINGRDIAKMTDAEQSVHRNRSVGFIFQRFNLINVLTALENVSLPLTLRGEKEHTSSRKALAMLEAVGLSSEAGRRPDKLSGGQQQRVAIARALVTKPLLVVADEPTANLDSGNSDHIVSLMRHFNRALGTTFLFSTHNERLLAQVSRRIRLHDGRIVEDVSGCEPRQRRADVDLD